ncbi:MAG: hypothetical protein ACJ768_08115 [Gaiellaceae bacterium]
MEDVIPGQLFVPAAIFGFFVFWFMVVILIGAIVLGVVFWWRDRRHDVGPDALRLLKDLDAHLDHFVANDPEVKAGIARLHAAMHDEQKGGEEG